jgi:hypothetical protein
MFRASLAHGVWRLQLMYGQFNLDDTILSAAFYAADRRAARRSHFTDLNSQSELQKNADNI